MTETHSNDRNFVTIGGHRLEYQWVGHPSSLAPLIFLHEGLGSIELWRDFPQGVCTASGRQGLIFSRYGNGWSDPLIGRRRPDYMHDEALNVLPKLLADLVGKEVILIGHSDGASIALAFAGSGGATKGLVLIAPHVIVEGESIEATQSSRERFLSTDLPQKMAKYHRDSAATFWGWNDIWLDPSFRDWNLTEYLPTITCPTLLVQGEKDEFGTFAQLDLIRQQMSGPTEQLLVEGAGHSPHLAEPVLVTKAVTSFLSALP